MTDDELREIASNASTSGNYSGGVKALRAVYSAGRKDVQKWLAQQLRSDAPTLQEFVPTRSIELLSYLLEEVSDV